MTPEATVDPAARTDRAEGKPISVVVVDDQQIVLAGVAALLARATDIEVVGTASDLQTAVDVIGQASPDVVLCDIQLGAESGLALLDQIGDDGPAIVLLSSFEHPGYYQAALERGAAGYVAKGALVDQLVDAIRTVASGGAVFPTHALRSRHGSARPPSQREMQVVLLVAEGSSNDEIGARLGISAKTVDSHLRALFDRYGVASRTELAMLAVAEGWIRARAATAGDAGAGRWLLDDNIVRSR